jgi:hypothetical protein
VIGCLEESKKKKASPEKIKSLNLERYENKELGFKFKYPSSWITNERRLEEVTLFGCWPSDESCSFSVFVCRKPPIPPKITEEREIIIGILSTIYLNVTNGQGGIEEIIDQKSENISFKGVLAKKSSEYIFFLRKTEVDRDYFFNELLFLLFTFYQWS